MAYDAPAGLVGEQARDTHGGGTGVPIPKPRWFRLMPDRFVIMLLVVEHLLWLWERCQSSLPLVPPPSNRTETHQKPG